MNILSMHTGHDASVAYFEDYYLKCIIKEERLSRIKSDGNAYPLISYRELSKNIELDKIDCICFTRSVFSRHETRLNFLKKLEYAFSSIFRGKKYYFFLLSDMDDKKNKKRASEFSILSKKKLKKRFGLVNNSEVFLTFHHRAHALPCIFCKPKWKNGLIYTADGDGDFYNYNIYFFNDKGLEVIHGDENAIYDPSFAENKNSLGRMYSFVTEALGFKSTRHEGKITGLAAYGSPVCYELLKEKFHISEEGIVHSRFKDMKDMKDMIINLSHKYSAEDLAASAQKVLEDVVVESIMKLKEKYDISNIGLSGGVFANVRLNQKISEIDGVKDVFVLPFMGDEGLPVGGALDLLIQKNGFDSFLANRRELGMPYFGEDFGDIKPYVDSSKFEIVEHNRDKIVAKTVELLRDKKICAIFTKGMEYGPRALGARSILIDPSDKSINDSVNKRLSRTEFMPFAPYVRIERVRDVFEVTESNLNAMKYMTITCNVKKEWHDKIPAVVHVDGTARPQTIEREDNPLYYDILHEFEKQTGIPCLVNTSFNAHEEPIINTPQEALKALEDDRVDYLIAQDCIIRRKLEA